MPVTRDDVICAYRYLLNRDPENEAAIDGHREAVDWRQLRQSFMGSDEYRYSNGYLDRWMVTPIFADTLLLWVNMRDKYVSIHCVMDAYEPENTELIRKLLHPGDIFLDLGANIGWFTMLASSIVGPSGHVHCFEPQPQIGDYLGRTIALNGLQETVTLHRAGVWHEPGSMALAWHETAENHGASHLVPGVSEVPMGSTVDLVVIDSLGLDGCDLIKMDIEGAEPRAMEGASRLLEKNRPIILSELHAGQLMSVSQNSCGDYISQMEARGYRCLESRGPSAGAIMTPDRDLAAAFTDVLFVPVEKVDWVTCELFGNRN